jgi:hypothetical protein
LVGIGGEAGKIAKERAPAGIIGLENLRGSSFVVVFGVERALKKQCESEGG